MNSSEFLENVMELAQRRSKLEAKLTTAPAAVRPILQKQIETIDTEADVLAKRQSSAAR